MRRVFLILSCIAVLLWGCSGRDAQSPGAVSENDAGSAVPGYPAAIAPEPAENESIISGYPAQIEEVSPSGSGTLVAEANKLVNELASQPPEPQQGMGSIYGVLFSVTNQAPIPNTMVYLIDAGGDEAESLPAIIVGPSSEDIVLSSDQNGAVVNDSIPPGNYYLVMSAPPYDWAEGYSDAEAKEPLLIQVRENEKTSMGVIYIFWP